MQLSLVAYLMRNWHLALVLAYYGQNFCLSLFDVPDEFRKYFHFWIPPLDIHIKTFSMRKSLSSKNILVLR